MIGLTRLALALLIMAAHLTQRFDMAAHLAVMSFYVMAGYFATYAKNERYSAPWAFWVSRYLRLWPGYLAVFLTTYALLLAFPDISPSRMGIPDGWEVVTQQLMVVPSAPHTALVPVAWMLKWMLLGYGVIALEASDTAQRCFGWLVITFILAQPVALTQDYASYYFSWQLALLGMAVGSTGYWLGIKVPQDGDWAASMGAISFPVYLTHPVVEVVGLAVGIPHGWALFCAAIVPTLALSWIMVVAVERPVQTFRSSLRNK